jgi:hypothetical protein
MRVDMAVNFTRQQIAELEEAMQRLAPPFPVARDLPQAKSVASVATIGVPAGLLINARLDDGSVTNLYLNPVVALDLLTRIMGVARKGQWWDENVDLIPMPDAT